MVLSIKRIRLTEYKSLILFFARFLSIQTCFLILLACSTSKESASVEILWENEQATGLLVPSSFLTDIPDDSVQQRLQIYIADKDSRVAILGDYHPDEQGIIFRPLVPFTSGLIYEVSVSGEAIGRIQIPAPDENNLPALLAVYPSQDTVPENLLKLYFTFSRPMRERQSLKHIILLKNGTDTVHGTFLDLQGELWDKEYTMLTLWLDPGRIKRDLQPNKRLGVPLEKANSYTLIVRSGWPDTRGAIMPNEFRKNFFVTARDTIRPDINGWMIKTVREGSADPLVIDLNESLDRALLTESLQIVSPDGNPVKGKIVLSNEERIFKFTPESPWVKGIYELRSEGVLEDLAGNNLNRLFDRDITKDPETDKEIFSKKFEVN